MNGCIIIVRLVVNMTENTKVPRQLKHTHGVCQVVTLQ